MMKSLFKMTALAATLSSAILSSNAFSQTLPVECPGYKPGKTQLVGERAGKKVQAAFEAYNQDLVKEALDILYDVETSDDFDRAYVDRFIGNLLASMEGQGAKAFKYLVSSVEKKVLNDLEHSQTMKLIGDLSMQEQKYTDAIKWYNAWMDFTCKQDPDVYTRMAQAYYESKQLDKMIEPADKAIALYPEPNKNPYVLKLTSYYERKMYEQTIEVAETLVNVFPEEPRWWTQLGLFYLLVEKYDKALSAFELSYNQGYLDKENQLKTLAQLYGTVGIPHKSAKVLQKGVKDGILKNTAEINASIANSHHQAKEYKLAAQYYGKAAEISSDPEHYNKQGTLLLIAEDYRGAIKALQTALDKGSDDVGKIHFSLMEANFYLGNYKQAMVHVNEAKKDSSLRRNATAWEPYIKDKAKNRGIKV